MLWLSALLSSCHKSTRAKQQPEDTQPLFQRKSVFSRVADLFPLEVNPSVHPQQRAQAQRAQRTWAHWQSDPLQPDLKRLFLQAAHPSHLSGHVHLLSPKSIPHQLLFLLPCKNSSWSPRVCDPFVHRVYPWSLQWMTPGSLQTTPSWGQEGTRNTSPSTTFFCNSLPQRASVTCFRKNTRLGRCEATHTWVSLLVFLSVNPFTFHPCKTS